MKESLPDKVHGKINATAVGCEEEGGRDGGQEPAEPLTFYLTGQPENMANSGLTSEGGRGLEGFLPAVWTIEESGFA